MQARCAISPPWGKAETDRDYICRFFRYNANVLTRLTMMETGMKATAQAHPNIAFIKYWGNADESLRLPANPSISMNLEGISTITTVEWGKDEKDSLIINGHTADAQALARVVRHLDVIRKRAGINLRAQVTSENNFPMGAGIASSASSFAALTVAAFAAAGVIVDERELSCVARLGSGSASRSIPAGYVEWCTGNTHEESYAFTVADAKHWDLVDVVAVISEGHKAVGSREGHTTATTSDFQAARVASAPTRLKICRQALLDRDFETFATVVEQDSNMMHAVMMTSKPPLFYWKAASLTVMEAVRQWRSEGIPVCYTLDAGPNVHCITMSAYQDEIGIRLTHIEGVLRVLKAACGGGARILSM